MKRNKITVRDAEEYLDRLKEYDESENTATANETTEEYTLYYSSANKGEEQ